jgi:hypothetical protein
MPTFWSEKSSNIIEPKRKYRFLVEILAFNGKPETTTSIVWFAKSATIPSYSVTSVTHKFLDNQYHFPGHVEWTEVSVKMVDPVSPDAVFLTHGILGNSGYLVPAAPGGSHATMSKKKSAFGAALQGMVITQLNADGQAIEKWTLQNPFLAGVEFGEFVYEGDDIREIDMKLKYDWATCQKLDPVTGAVISDYDPVAVAGVVTKPPTGGY